MPQFRRRARDPVASWYAGPMIRKTVPNVLGVSSPSGMAVTSDRPVSPRQPKRHGRIDQVADQNADGRARDHPRQNEHLWACLNAPTSRLPIKIMTPMLSSISPKNALTSPRRAQP